MGFAAAPPIGLKGSLGHIRPSCPAKFPARDTEARFFSNVVEEEEAGALDKIIIAGRGLGHKAARLRFNGARGRK